MVILIIHDKRLLVARQRTKGEISTITITLIHSEGPTRIQDHTPAADLYNILLCSPTGCFINFTISYPDLKPLLLTQHVLYALS